MMGLNIETLSEFLYYYVKYPQTSYDDISEGFCQVNNDKIDSNQIVYSLNNLLMKFHSVLAFFVDLWLNRKFFSLINLNHFTK